MIGYRPALAPTGFTLDLTFRVRAILVENTRIADKGVGLNYMASETYNFGTIDRLQASSVGLPGQRTFRVQLLNENGESASLWIEKEQMQALGSAVDQLIAQLSDEHYVDLATRDQPEHVPAPETYFPEPPVVEFKIGRLALGYDEERAGFTLLVHDIESDQEGVAGFRCLVTREQLQGLSEQIEIVVNAGRPHCPLCGQPLTVGAAHFCPPSNGHARVE